MTFAMQFRVFYLFRNALCAVTAFLEPAIKSSALLIAGFALCTLISGNAHAGTLVRMNTSLGGVTIELFDDVAPGTVANFLNYVSSGRYNGTVIHRSQPGFVIQGGWLSFDEPAQNFISLTADANIVNEFNISNTRGTLAMAKVAGNPDSANSQWFINLTDNLFLDTDNGGFTVFGRVVDGTMAVVDAIAALPLTNLIQGFDPFPLINFTSLPLKNSHLVRVDMSVIENTSVQPNVYDAVSGLLHTRIDAGSLGLLSLSFSLYAVTPEVVIQALASSLKTLPDTTANIATFDAQTNRLTIPEFVIDGAIAFRNVVFEFSDANKLLFTLKSAD